MRMGYTIVGPNREIYLECSQPVRQDDDSYAHELRNEVTEE
jgi:effector-binding domain-containing protein